MKPVRPELGLPQFPLNERVSEGAHMAHTQARAPPGMPGQRRQELRVKTANV